MPNSTRPKTWRRRVLSSPPVSAALRSLERSVGPRGQDTLVVAMFHETLSAERFEAQLDVLLEGREIVSGGDVVEAIAGRRPLPASALWITFDDAYGDFYERAWPVLERRGLAATQFVPTAFVGSSPAGFWWDRLQAAFQYGRAQSVDIPLAHGGARAVSLASPGKAWKLARTEIKRMPHARAMQVVDSLVEQLDAPDLAVDSRVMTWEELDDLVSRGLGIGGHTRHHPMLDQLTPAAAAEEITQGFSDLRERWENVLPVLAFPSGQYNGGVIQACRDSGVEIAVTTRNGFHRMSSGDPMQIRRVPIGPLADAAAVRLRLAMAGRAGA